MIPKKSKKSQFYILAAVLLAAVMLSTILITKKPVIEDYENDIRSFEREGGYAISSAIYSGNNLQEAFEKFVQDYTDNNKGVELAYFLKANFTGTAMVLVGNHLGDDILIEGASLMPGETKLIDKKNFSFQYKGINYSIAFLDDDSIELKKLFVQKSYSGISANRIIIR